MEQHLKQYYPEEITELLNDSNDAAHVSLSVCLTKLQRDQPVLFERLLSDAHGQAALWNAALLRAQTALLEDGSAFLEPDFQIKINCHVRFVRLPPASGSSVAGALVASTSIMGTMANSSHASSTSATVYPSNDQVGRFVQVHGSVVRMTQAKLLEFKREYVCSKCKHSILVQADYARMYVLEPPRGGCPTPGGCRGTLYQKSATPVAEHCIDVQEIRIQEVMSERNMPASMLVTLDNDLVDVCQPGDVVTICGTVELRWRPLQPGKRPDVSLALRALSVRSEEKRRAIVAVRDLPEHLLCVRAEWQEAVDTAGGGDELAIRDHMLRSFCPEIHGMYLVKLAVLLALSSGVNGRSTAGSAGQHQQRLSSGRPAASAGSSGAVADYATEQRPPMQTRGSSHVILVGDPGLAKSKLLRFAAAVAVRAVHTTGMGCSSAGLTAAAVKENGEWQLEAGALVLADGGVCCIDEFNMMRETDKAAIHEAMEQQSISMAKAGLVCKLSTRCIVVAATNPKNLRAMQATDGAVEINIGIASPLLSRFDVVLILRDERDPEWDDRVAGHLLRQYTQQTDEEEEESTQTDAGGDDPVMPLWTEPQFQAHLTAIRDICPTVSAAANDILSAYFRRCRADASRDPARTTVRLLDSLMRLARAHARLMFRDIVTEVDAVAVVRLMESSWGFGNILQPANILRAQLPIGPSASDVRELKDRLGLPTDVDEVVERKPGPDGEDMFGTETSRRAGSSLIDMGDRQEEDFTQMTLLTNQHFVQTATDDASQLVRRSQAEVDEIMSWADFDDDHSMDAKPASSEECFMDKTNKRGSNENDLNVPQMDATVDEFVIPEKRSRKHSEPSISSADVCRPKVAAKTVNKLNMFRNDKYVRYNEESISNASNSNDILVSNNLTENMETISQVDNRENIPVQIVKELKDNNVSKDSAYDSILCSSTSSTQPSSSNSQYKSFMQVMKENDEDLDFLDDIDKYIDL